MFSVEERVIPYGSVAGELESLMSVMRSVLINNRLRIDGDSGTIEVPLVQDAADAYAAMIARWMRTIARRLYADAPEKHKIALFDTDRLTYELLTAVITALTKRTVGVLDVPVVSDDSLVAIVRNLLARVMDVMMPMVRALVYNNESLVLRVPAGRKLAQEGDECDCSTRTGLEESEDACRCRGGDTKCGGAKAGAVDSIVQDGSEVVTEIRRPDGSKHVEHVTKDYQMSMEVLANVDCPSSAPEGDADAAVKDAAAKKPADSGVSGGFSDTGGDKAGKPAVGRARGPAHKKAAGRK